jgi:hypothetical protein
VSRLCGNSSVGRAQPCQGWGREFESRFPLHEFCSQEKEEMDFGWVAEWPCSGLQSRVRRFDSGLSLHFRIDSNGIFFRQGDELSNNRSIFIYVTVEREAKSTKYKENSGRIYARVAKLVDARDLKSLGAYPSVPVRFRPRALLVVVFSTKLKNYNNLDPA